MPEFLNQYSFLIFGLVLVGLAVYGLSRRGFRRLDWLPLIALVALIVGAWWVLHPTASQAADAAAVREQIGSGSPVLLEFQSPY